MLIIFIFISIVPVLRATIGVDVNQKVTQEQFQCLKDSGYTFVIVRAYRSNGIVDFNSIQTIKNARAVGLKYIDAYLLPCFACGDGAQQVFETIDYLQDENAAIDRLWLDIQGRWHNLTHKNIQFIDELILQVKTLGVKVGIHTSKTQWFSIMNDITQFSSSIPLWYTQHNNEKSFDDFRPFGGWGQPTMKQYIGDVKECGVVLDKNFT